MAEALDARELVEALQPERGADFFPLNDLPNDVLVSVFAAAENPTWVRHTFPLVCKAWNELYLTKDASPLHETLEVHFKEEVKRAWQEWLRLVARPVAGAATQQAATQQLAPHRPVVHASRVISWAEMFAGSVRKLYLKGDTSRALEDFSSEDLGALVAVVGSSLTEISIWHGFGQLCKGPFWKSVRTSVVPAGLLRSLFVLDITSDLSESDLEALGPLAGSLEELALWTENGSQERGLPRFPESLFALKELRRLNLTHHAQITAIPAGISSLQKLEDLDLAYCNLSSLPKELGELSRLTNLNFGGNKNLGTAAAAFPAELGRMTSLRKLDLKICGLRTVPAFVCELKSLEVLDFISNSLSSLPKELFELSGLTGLYLGANLDLGRVRQDQAFPAEFKKMKSLRDLDLAFCNLRTVPSFVGELESLERLGMTFNVNLQIDAPLDFLLEGCPRLRWVELSKGRQWTRKSLKHLEAFKAKMLAKNPDAKVSYESGGQFENTRFQGE